MTASHALSQLSYSPMYQSFLAYYKNGVKIFQWICMELLDAHYISFSRVGGFNQPAPIFLDTSCSITL